MIHVVVGFAILVGVVVVMIGEFLEGTVEGDAGEVLEEPLASDAAVEFFDEEPGFAFGVGFLLDGTHELDELALEARILLLLLLSFV